MRAQRECVGGIEVMANTTKLTPMQKEELNDKLIAAAESGDVESVKRLIENGADVDAKDKDGEKALHKAAWMGQVEVATFLIEKGVNVNMKNKNNETAAEIALRYGYHQIAELIDDSIKNRKALDILDMDMNELVRLADESAKRLCRKD